MGRLWIAAILLAGCVRSKSVVCDDGSSCAGGHQCIPQSDATYYCALPVELEACANLVNGDACGDGTANLYCRDQLCVAGACGDGVISGPELCDTDGDPTCAQTCLSRLECGNAVRDPGEDCDDGNAIAGDGCNVACRLESPRWTELSSLTPPPRWGHAMAYDARRDRTILFGGALYPNGDEDGATWERDASGYWSERRISIAPPARQLHGMAFDSARDRTIVFGGTLDGFYPTADLWEWDGQEWTLPPAPSGPPARLRSMMAYDPIRKVTVVVGGRVNSDRPMQTAVLATDAWSWDGTTWTELPSPSTTVGRCCGAMTFDPIRGRLVMTGGLIEVFDGANFDLVASSDTFAFDGTAWTTLPAGAFPDGGIYRPVLAFDPVLSAIVAVSGQSGESVEDGSGTTYRLDASAWSELEGAVNPARIEASLTPTRKGLMLVGGQAGRELTEILFFDEQGWAERVAPDLDELVNPYRFASDIVNGRTIGLTLARTEVYRLDALDLVRHPIQGASFANAGDVTVAYDEARHELLVVRFSDFSAPPPTGTTYRCKLDVPSEPTWQCDEVPAPGPPTRRGAAMVYDPARARVVLFGGIMAGSGATDQTWIFDGTTWSELALTERPSPRFDFPIAYDRRTSEVVVFGGEGSDGQVLADTWSLGDSGWRRRDATAPAAPRPLARSLPHLAYDLERARVVLFGGSLEGSQLADTWELVDDAGWVRVFADNAPSGPTQALITAPDGRGVLRIGTTSLARLTWGSDLPVDACIALDSDGDGDAGCDDPDCWHVCSPLCRPDVTTVCTESPRCGDGIRNGVESCQTCPVDMGACSVCGDFICDGVESVATCPGDCSV